MSISVNGAVITANNGDANDVVPVKSAVATLSANDALVAAEVNDILLGNIKDSKTLTVNSNDIGAPSGNQALVFNRGSSTDATIRWNETANVLEATNAGLSYYPLLADGVGGAPPTWTSVTQITIPSGCWAVDSTKKHRITAPSNLVVTISSNGVNGLDTGSEASNTKYYLWLCEGGSGVCGLLSLSATTPTLPTGYNTYFGLLPVLCYNNSSSDLLAFDVSSWTTGNVEVGYKSLTGATVSTTFNPGAVWTNLTVNTFLPTFAGFVRLNVSAPSACTMLFSTTGSTFGTEFQIGVNASFLLPTPFIGVNGSLQIQGQSNVSQNHTVYVSGYKVIRW